MPGGQASRKRLSSTTVRISWCKLLLVTGLPTYLYIYLPWCSTLLVKAWASWADHCSTCLAHNFVGCVHSRVSEALQHMVIESEARKTFTLIWNPLLPDGSICCDPPASHIPPCVSSVLLVKQHLVHFRNGQFQLVDECLNEGGQDCQVSADDAIHRSCIFASLEVAFLPPFGVVRWEFHIKRAQFQESRIWRPPIERQVGQEGQLHVGTPWCRHSNCSGHVVSRKLLHCMFYSPCTGANEGNAFR